MTETILLLLILTAAPAAEVTFAPPVEKAQAADTARELLRKQGCEQPVVEMLDRDASGRERLRVWCRR